MSDTEGPGEIQPKGESEPRPEIDPDLDVDSAFAAIVADFAVPAVQGAHGVNPWPASEDLEDEPAPVPIAPVMPIERREGAVRRIVIAGIEPADSGDDEPEEVDEGGYVPPEPPPFPRGDLVARLAWGAVIGGPVFLLIAALLWRSMPTLMLLVALLAFVAGFVTLVARMPPDHPDDQDDGAVV